MVCDEYIVKDAEIIIHFRKEELLSLRPLTKSKFIEHFLSSTNTVNEERRH